MQKKVTINQVAEQAGVSKTTISRFLNGRYGNMSQETKEKIAKVIKELNYRPSRQAQALKSKRSYLIGVVVADISNMYSSLLLKGIGEILGKQGYQMIIMDAANSIEQERELLEKLLDQGVEGIILQPSSRGAEHYDFLREHQIPLLLVDRQTEPVQWPAVITDNVSSVKRIMEEVLAKKYKRVIVLSEPIEDVTTREIRYQTVAEHGKAAGVAVTLHETTLDEHFKVQIMAFLSSKEKTIFFASNGRVLMALLTALIEEKIAIPERVGVTGFDDWRMTALIGPGITSIEQPSRTIGRVAADKILNALQMGGNPVEETIVPSDLQWRHSI
ncbi:HTH-type transcriptional regulator KdgR [Enterococcus florum]|uniref:HTH-type transcriptional regulator KdgR n=1 Tax=Enterococcus florum TaxID=2480627 RepID=A0A4P5PEF8_9ENTE|nr:LacI family DNA-binding transcriptional regulator [Enterococcus florum]GCF95014.1 HTH-type transcriptional regulator KdgR [Enterococcus florum]